MLRTRGWSDTLAASGQRGCAEQGGQSTSEERRWQCQRQVRLPTVGAVSHPRGSRKTVSSTHALSGDTASKSPVFSTREAGPWTGPSSSAPSAGQCTGRGQTRCAEAAHIIQVGAPSVAQVEVRPVSSQTVPWLDSRGCSTTYPVRGIDFGGAAGVMRGGLGSNGAWANNLEEAAHEAASCDAARLAHRRNRARSHRQCGEAARARAVQHLDKAQPAELAASLGPSKFRPHVPLCLRHPDFIFPGTCRMDEEVCKS